MISIEKCTLYSAEQNCDKNVCNFAILAVGTRYTRPFRLKFALRTSDKNADIVSTDFRITRVSSGSRCHKPPFGQSSSRSMWKLCTSRHFHARCSSLGRNVESRTIELDQFPLALMHCDQAFVDCARPAHPEGRLQYFYGVRRNGSLDRVGTCIMQNWLRMKNSRIIRTYPCNRTGLCCTERTTPFHQPGKAVDAIEAFWSRNQGRNSMLTKSRRLNLVTI